MRAFIFALLVLLLLLISLPLKGDTIVCDHGKDNPLIDPATQCWVVEDKEIEANIPESSKIEIYVCEWNRNGNYACKEI